MHPHPTRLPVAHRIGAGLAQRVHEERRDRAPCGQGPGHAHVHARQAKGRHERVERPARVRLVRVTQIGGYVIQEHLQVLHRLVRDVPVLKATVEDGEPLADHVMDARPHGEARLDPSRLLHVRERVDKPATCPLEALVDGLGPLAQPLLLRDVEGEDAYAARTQRNHVMAHEVAHLVRGDAHAHPAIGHPAAIVRHRSRRDLLPCPAQIAQVGREAQRGEATTHAVVHEEHPPVPRHAEDPLGQLGQRLQG